VSLAYTPNLYTLLSNHADRENNKEKFLNPLLAKALTLTLSQWERESSINSRRDFTLRAFLRNVSQTSGGKWK